ncbi:MAG: cytochrome c peroxidase [Planctomycetales bacterium]
MKPTSLFAILLALIGLVIFSPVLVRGEEPRLLEQLGKQIFFDPQLSNPVGQSCASCHHPATGFTGPQAKINLEGAVMEGAVKGRFGKRKPPTVSYASFSPSFSRDPKSGDTTGGQFWDGRAHTLTDQATGPLLNPLEQNNADAVALFKKLQHSSYRPLFEKVHGAGTLEDSPENVNQVLSRIAASLAAYESSHEVNPFSSKYDAYLAGQAKLSPSEARGLELFAGKANCANCHPHKPGDDGSPPLFTDFTYDNLGIPRNRLNPFYRMPADINPDGEQHVDLGLYETVKEQELRGAFKVPTLRNVDRRPHPGFVKAYTHNGYFKSLKDVIHFYNLRDVRPGDFPPAEVPETVNHEELGNLKLTDAEENDLVAFLKTLTDGYMDSDQVAEKTPKVEKIPQRGQPVSSPVVARPATFQRANDLQRIQQFRRQYQQTARPDTPQKSTR